MGGILTIIAFHVLDLYKVREWERGHSCIIGQFTNVLRSSMTVESSKKSVVVTRS